MSGNVNGANGANGTTGGGTGTNGSGSGNSQLSQAFDTAISEAQQTLQISTVKQAQLNALRARPNWSPADGSARPLLLRTAGYWLKRRDGPRRTERTTPWQVLSAYQSEQD